MKTMNNTSYKTFASLYHLNTFLFLFFTKTNEFFLIKMILFICLVVDFLIFFRKSIKKYFHKKNKKKLNSRKLQNLT